MTLQHCGRTVAAVCVDTKEALCLDSAVVLTLDVRQVLLVLVNFTAIDGEGQAFEQHGSLLQLSISVREQTQRAALRYSHSCCRETYAVIFCYVITTRKTQTVQAALYHHE